jgi:hypothetical protein
VLVVEGGETSQIAGGVEVALPAANVCHTRSTTGSSAR